MPFTSFGAPFAAPRPVAPISAPGAEVHGPARCFHLDPQPTVSVIAERWLASRIDVAERTQNNHRAAVSAIVALIGDRRVDSITPQDVAELVTRLCDGRRRETIRKILIVLGMIFDHADITPNPARDKVAVKLPFERKAEIVPPTADHVRAVHDTLPPRCRLPLLVLDATGMRLGELEQLTWGDVDEPRGRWRVSQAVSKTGRGRWVGARRRSSRPSNW